MTSSSYKQYLLFILGAILAIEQVDSIAFGLLLQSIKVSLDLSDSQLGFLSGMAFALFYATLGVPIGRWADRGNRVVIISATTILWSIMVALTSSARSFLQLLLVRIGVAVGESGCTPPSYSLIGDYFSRGERERAMGKYLLAGATSVIVGNFVCGWLGQAYGWRAVFLPVAVPGLALAIVALLTVKEPRALKANDTWPQGDRVAMSHGRSIPAKPTTDEIGVWRASVTLFQNATFRNLMIGWSICWFFGNGIGQWQPAYFMRSFHAGAGEVGTWFSLIYGVGGLIAT
jgi:MFS family permease